MLKLLIVLAVIFAVILLAGAAAYFHFFPILSPAQRLARFKEEVRPKNGTIFETILEGKPTAFLLQDCKLYLLAVTAEAVKKERVLEPDFYLGFTTCTRQEIKLEGEYLKVFLSQQAVGAGGGNAGGGNYRSKNGRDWEKQKDGTWRPVTEP